ncbi:MAG: GNAT family N-acetyltransferase [Actinomycetota bacterium]
MPTVRVAQESDLERLLDIYVEVAAERMWIGAEPPIDRDERLEKWRQRMAEGSAVTVVVEDDDAIVGSASLQGTAGPCGTGVMDLGMALLAPYRGRGLGSMLVKACIDRARSAGAHKITLQVWPHNEAARALYRKFGFEEEGYLRRQWRRSNGELWDAVVMGLLLEDDP